MECFDRVGEREKLHTALSQPYSVCVVSGKSGVGKSEIISAVVASHLGDRKYLKYEYGKAPLSLADFLLAYLRETRPKKSRILDFVKSIKVDEIVVSIPGLGKAPVRLRSDEMKLGSESLAIRDVINALDGPLFFREQKIFQKINKLLMIGEFPVLWIANAELISPRDFADLCLTASSLSKDQTLIIEGAFNERRLEDIEEVLSNYCSSNDLNLSLHPVRPFNTHFAKAFYHHLQLDKKGVAFNYLRNGGFPVAIKYDLDQSDNVTNLGSRLQGCISDDDMTASSLVLLAFLYSIEKRYDKIIQIADKFGITLKLDKLVQEQLATLTESECELSHPKIAQFILLMQRHELFRLLKTYYEDENGIDYFQVDLASMSYLNFMKKNKQIELIEIGLKRTLKALDQNNLNECDSILAFLEDGIRRIEDIKNTGLQPLINKVQILRLQVDTLLCRWSGSSTGDPLQSPFEMILAAQVRMRNIELKSSIALSELAEASLETISTSQSLSDDITFSAKYIRLSCLIALGCFDEYSQQRDALASWLKDKPQRYTALFFLLPGTYELDNGIPIDVSTVDDFLAARLLNNFSCDLMMKDSKSQKIGQMLKKSLVTVTAEGSVEGTFPMNNQGLYLLYCGNLMAASNLFFDMISYCIYPYDYFSAYNNLSISLACQGKHKEALAYAIKAGKYISNGELSDPVFEIKSSFNIAFLQHYNGDPSGVEELKSRDIDYNSLPKRYRNVFPSKLNYALQLLENSNALGIFRGDNIETANILWPQNLMFWDFMYPLITTENFSDVISLHYD